MAATERLPWLRHLIDVALTERCTTAIELRAGAAERHRRRAPGMVGFMGLLTDVLDDEPLAESVAELRFFDAHAQVGLTDGTRQWMPLRYDGGRGIVDAG